MKEMTHRTTFALDQATARRLRRLAAVWQVSQAEVVRRAVALAENKDRGDKDAAFLLREFHASGKGLVKEKAEEYLAQVRNDRTAWRSGE
jgi:predicted transcriptional regulator